MATKHVVTGDQRLVAYDRFAGIQRQLKTRGGSSLDPEHVAWALQQLSEGRRLVVAPSETSASAEAVTSITPSSPVLTFPTWRTVEIGRYGSHTACVAALEAKNRKIGTYAAQILPKVEFATTRLMINVVRTTPRGLGFTEGTPRRDKIVSRANKHGLIYCPAEIGPIIREDYGDQPMNEWLIVMMEPLEDSGGDLSVFYVGRYGGGEWLNTYCGYPGLEFGLEHGLLFVRSK